MIRFYAFIGIIFLLVWGCSSDHTLKSTSSNRGSVGNSLSNSQTDSSFVSDDAENCDSGFVDPNRDEAINELLERARQHYQRALEAQGQKDSAQSANEFEYAIGMLNELAYYPNIDTNKDFNDLSRSVVEDYEKYIAIIDSLGPQTSIFALRQKLNQFDESESADQDAPKKVITTTSVPLIINGHVEKNIQFFQERGREHFEHWLYLSGRFFPLMKKIFREEGVPEDLVYLSMVESGLNPSARSWAKAVGLWQFVKGTGLLYGLNGNSWYDERRDFEKASHAAARHLKDLNSEFGDWYLALAAYNSGSGRVSSAIRRSKSTDFWKMRPYLPKETRNYVPQFIAVAVMTIDQKSYNFSVAPADTLKYEYVKVNDCVDLTVLAQCAGTSVDSLRDLNPELLQWCSPPGFKGYRLRVPVGSGLHFDERYAAIPEDQKHDWIVYKVHKRESFASIARKYGITAALLYESNHLVAGSRVKAGTSIVIPVPASAKMHASNVANDLENKSAKNSRSLAKSLQGKEKLVYHVRKGDTLGKIAGWYDVRVSNLRVWNEIPYGSSIQAGSVISVWEPKEIASRYTKIDAFTDNEHSTLLTVRKDSSAAQKDTVKAKKGVSYKVKKGDTLHSIASTFGVSIVQLRAWNNIRGNHIHVGQEILINS